MVPYVVRETGTPGKEAYLVMNIEAFLGTERRQWQEAVLAEAARDRLIAQLPRSKDVAHVLASRLITFLLQH